MGSQDDLASLEAVNTAHRTMSYDYERLVKMHNQAKEDSASAERKEQAARSQLTCVPLPSLCFGVVPRLIRRGS